MATTKNTKPAAAPRRPLPPLAPKSPETGDGKLDTSAAANPKAGIDPRATDEKNALEAAAGRVVGTPPTPTVDGADVDNSHPGAGGLGFGETQPFSQLDPATQATLERNGTDGPAKDADAKDAPVRRRSTNKDVEKVSVTVPRGFTLTTDDGKQHRYEAGIQDIPREHAEHAYSAANGVELNED
jgi:hypothetical protein